MGGAGNGNRSVTVGVSGGVDSSVAALLLAEAGYEVRALFMKNWDDGAGGGACPWEEDVEAAMQVCDRLGIALDTVDLTDEYRDTVFRSFVEEYRGGRTPNPDVLCNQEIKFRAFLDQALEGGADFIATGHYARIRNNGPSGLLLKGADPGKDQSYFLCRLGQGQLTRTLFPLGDMHKRDVRRMAAKAGFANHDRRDSTGVCFISPDSFRRFLASHLPPRPGEIRTPEGRVIGEHEGAHFYTVGQRHGLGVGGIPGAGDSPWYVVDKNMEENVVTVVQGSDHALLYSSGLVAGSPHWIGGRPPAGEFRCSAKTRYRQPDQACAVTVDGAGGVSVAFEAPQRAVTPGQYVVFYDGEICLGSAVIERSRR